MKNRAKCKLCNGIIESFHDTDYVLCKCSEISVSGGLAMYCSARDFANFVRVDDEGNEIIVKVKDIGVETKSEVTGILDQKCLLSTIEEMIKTVENMPQHALSSPISHYDYCNLLMLMCSLLKCIKSE